jgi:hypothetical protein
MPLSSLYWALYFENITILTLYPTKNYMDIVVIGNVSTLRSIWVSLTLIIYLSKIWFFFIILSIVWEALATTCQSFAKPCYRSLSVHQTLYFGSTYSSLLVLWWVFQRRKPTTIPIIVAFQKLYCLFFL